MDSVRRQVHSRREILRGLGLIGGAVLLSGPLMGCSEPGVGRTAARFVTGERYFIAHRGAGDEAPEHTLEAYRRILERGAGAIEISVHRTLDGVLVCHHDPTLERTSPGATGTIKEMNWVELMTHRIDMRRSVGPAWGTQVIPRLDDVLDAIGGRAVLFVEPKDPAAAADVLHAVTSRRQQDTTVWKQHWKATGDGPAREAELAVWNYWTDDATASDLPGIAARSDAIGVEITEPVTPARIKLVKAAVATGTPVIAWALHRRYAMDQLAALGVRGFMCSAWTYLSGEALALRQDAFAGGRVAPGDRLGDYTTDTGPVWNDDGSVGLTATNGPQSLTMGSLSPIAAPDYTLRASMRFDALPPTSSQHAGIVIGRDDDRPFVFRKAGPSGGQLVILRGDGTLELRQVPTDNGESTLIVGKPGPPVVAGRWESLIVQAQGDQILVTRTPDGLPTMRIAGPRIARGGYVVLTRNYSAPNAALRFRKVDVEFR